MTKLMSVFWLALAMTVISPAFAETNWETLTTQEECEGAGGDWDVDRDICGPSDPPSDPKESDPED